MRRFHGKPHGKPTTYRTTSSPRTNIALASAFAVLGYDVRTSGGGHMKSRFDHLTRALGLAASIAGAVGSADAASDCAGLVNVKVEGVTIASASVISGPSTIGGARVGVPFCRVEGVAQPSSDSEIRFEVWLPSTADKWTGRMKVDGTGGYAGRVPYALLAQDIGDGFVTAGSNMGHDGGESSAWTLNHPEKVKDWGLRAHYSVSVAAKSLAKALYGHPVKYSYFEGCSNGGRQALMM